MKRNCLKKIGSLIVLLIVCTIFTPYNIKAKESLDKPIISIEEKEALDKLWKEADRRPVVIDSKSNNLHFRTNFFRSSNEYPRRSGVILVTKDSYHGLPIGHAAIIYDYDNVVESFKDGGVQKGENDWDGSKKTCYALNVKDTDAIQDEDAADWAYAQIGKPYNIDFNDIDTRDKFYCSQLVWAAYKDTCGIDISVRTPGLGRAIYPPALLKSKEVEIIYKQK